jgi:phage-related protein
LREFPQEARQQAGHELYEVQKGAEPTNWKPMPTVGAGVREIRVGDASGAYRVIYIANLPICPTPSMCCTPSRRRPRKPRNATWL